MKRFIRARPLTASLALVLALALAACTQVPLRSLWQLRQLDWQQLDPAVLLALAYLPEGIEARPDAAIIIVKVERGNAAAEVLEERLLLRPVDAAAQAPRPEAPGRRGKWLALSLDAQQQARFQALRSTMQAWKAQDGADAKRKLSISLEPQMCRRSSTPPQTLEALRVSAWLRWQAQQAPVLLLDEAGLADLSERPASAAMPLC
jgi:hypothetical protein